MGLSEWVAINLASKCMVSRANTTVSFELRLNAAAVANICDADEDIAADAAAAIDADAEFDAIDDAGDDGLPPPVV